MASKPDILDTSIDARQAKEWGEFLRLMGWDIQRIGKIGIYIRKVPFLNHSVIKIQHPIGPIPFKKLDAIAKKYKSVYSVIEPHPYGYKEKEYKKHGYMKSKFRFAHTATMKIDLRPALDAIFRSFSQNARRNIKKAQQKPIKIKAIFLKDEKDDVWFAEFYRLLKNLGKMKKFYVPSYGEFFKKATAFKKNSFLLFALDSDNNDEPIAVVWYGFYDKVISYFQTGIVTRGYDVLANYLLVWEGIKIAKDLKLQLLDFESVYDPRYPRVTKRWKNYTEFKSRFHGRFVEYPPAWIKFYNIFFKLAYLVSTPLARD